MDLVTTSVELTDMAGLLIPFVLQAFRTVARAIGGKWEVLVKDLTPTLAGLVGVGMAFIFLPEGTDLAQRLVTGILHYGVVGVGAYSGAKNTVEAVKIRRNGT